MIETIEFKGKRKDTGDWITGNLFIPNQFLGGNYICPKTTFADFMTDFEDGDDIADHRGNGIGLGHFNEVIAESVGQFTGIEDKNGNKVFSGDLHLTEPVEVDGEMKSSYLPVVFDNGAFWLDESFDKDGSLLTLLCEYDEPLNIQGNIHDNPELLTTT